MFSFYETPASILFVVRISAPEFIPGLTVEECVTSNIYQPVNWYRGDLAHILSLYDGILTRTRTENSQGRTPGFLPLDVTKITPSNDSKLNFKHTMSWLGTRTLDRVDPTLESNFYKGWWLREHKKLILFLLLRRSIIYHLTSPVQTPISLCKLIHHHPY